MFKLQQNKYEENNQNANQTTITSYTSHQNQCHQECYEIYTNPALIQLLSLKRKTNYQAIKNEYQQKLFENKDKQEIELLDYYKKRQASGPRNILTQMLSYLQGGQFQMMQQEQDDQENDEDYIEMEDDDDEDDAGIEHEEDDDYEP